MALKHVLLTVLHHRPATGYEVLKEFEAVLGFFWDASHQQIYRDLGRLSDDGLVRFEVVDQDDRPDKKVYYITEEGREVLRRWVEGPMDRKRVREDLLVKLLAGELVGRDGMKDIIRGQRGVQEAQLSTYRAIEKEYFSATPIGELPFDEQMAYLALRRGITGVEAWLAWADEAEKVITKLDR